MKLLAVYPEGQEELKDWFVNSIQDKWEFKIVKYGSSDDLASKEYYKTIKEKFRLVVEEIKNNIGGILLIADIDIQFFKPATKVIVKALEGKDLVALAQFSEGIDDINAGFIAIICNEKTLKLFELVLSTNLSWKIDKGDQYFLNKFLKTGTVLDLRYGILPKQFWMKRHSNGIPPKDIILHHAVQDGEKGSINLDVRMKLKFEQLKQIKRDVDFFKEEYFFDRFLAGTCWDYHKQAFLNLRNPTTRKREFPELLIQFLKKKPLKLLEIGCGAFSNLAWGIDNKLFEITATDSLGDKYTELLEKHNVDFPIKPIKMDGEDIDKNFLVETFDIVYARNSIDHSTDPKKVINNAVKILKKGGILFIEGFVKEGTYTKWSGLHQFDFVIEGNDLVCYTKKGNKINLTNDLNIKKIMQSSESSIKEPPDEEKYTIVFKK